jgi:hypothetical protein
MPDEFVWGPQPSEEEIASIKRALQDAQDGFTYEVLDGGKTRCNKCGRVGKFLERPFPHKLECPMRKYFGDC